MHRMTEARAKKINRLELQSRGNYVIWTLGCKKEMHKCRRCEKDSGDLIEYDFSVPRCGVVTAKKNKLGGLRPYLG